MKLINRKTVSFVACLIFPSILWAASLDYYPRDVAHIFLDEKSHGNFQVLLELNDGELYRLRQVSFDGTRYQLYEDIAYMIGKHRDFRGFDDEDVQQLIWGIAPFTLAEVSDVKTYFTEEELAITLYFGTGDTATTRASLSDVRFSSSLEVSEFIALTINNMAQFEGVITAQRVKTLHSEDYTGLSYFAPALKGVTIDYSIENENFPIEIVFANEEIRSLSLDFKDTKEQIYRDITNVINERYIEYEDAHFSLDEIRARSNFADTVPWMIDEMESITFEPNVAMDGTLQFIVRARISDSLVGVLELNTVYGYSVKDIDQIASAAVTVLEENELFVHSFDYTAVRDILVDSIAEEDLVFYGLADVEVLAVDEKAPTFEVKETALTSTVSKLVPPVNSVEQSPQTNEDIFKETEIVPKVSKEVVSGKNQIEGAAGVSLLRALIVSYIKEHDLDIDTKSLFTN